MALSAMACKKDDDTDSDEAPTAAFTSTATYLSVTFTNASTGEGLTYSWDFGDGETDNTASPTHTYAAAGTYDVVLTVTNTGGTDEATESITVEAQPTAEPPTPTIAGADGMFVAINTTTVTEVAGFEVETNLGSAVAWFKNGSSFVNVGKVKWKQGSNTGTLEINDNNTYSWVETTIPTEGFNDNGISWTIDGGGGFPSIGGGGLSNPYPFPSTSKISETSSTVDGDSEYTLSHDGAISDADTTYFSVFGPDATITKAMAGSTTSATFTAAEMASAGKGTTILQIASFKMASDASTGKTYYMINEAVASSVVTLD